MTRLLLLTLLLVGAGSAWAADKAMIAQLTARLAALDADQSLQALGTTERQQAVQAIAFYAGAKRKDRDAALYIAQSRIEIAELAAKTDAARQQLASLDQVRDGLQVEVERRETARKLQEAEQLRMQQLILAEEAGRQRIEAEQALTKEINAQQAEFLKARKKSAALAREEAELVSGAKLPKSSFLAGGAEVFVLPASLFNAGKSTLSTAGKSTVKALAAYMSVIKNAKIQIDGYSDSAMSGAQRSAALRSALIAAGVSKARISEGNNKGDASKAQASQVIVSI